MSQIGRSVPSSSPSLQGSQNYIWSLGECLGKGASATVYRGRHKKTGDLCAVKVFKNDGRFRITTWTRELELLRKLDHKNIIKVYAIDEEYSTKEQVLVMELCAGSVWSMLEEPEYAFGFPEEEFLVVLCDVASGVQYLRQQGIVHRDIKPGNIMRLVGSNNKSVYKLADFGAARELEEEENFMSLCGTEEYLHPDIYGRAVLRQPAPRPFGSNVDLWSLGVTFFHIATGELPFQPFGGRQNTETMFRITDQKEYGAICGVQKEKDGPIMYGRELPQTCRLSGGLKLLMTPLLAGLLERDPRLMWSFDKLFEHARKIQEMMVLSAFDVTGACEISVYINKNDMYSKLQELIAEQTDIAASSQLILVDTGSALHEVIDQNEAIKNYPMCVRQSKLYVFRSEFAEPQKLYNPDIPPIPEFASYINYEKDSSLAHSCCDFIQYLIHRTTETVKHQSLLVKAVLVFRSYVQRIRLDATVRFVDNTILVNRESIKRLDAFVYTNKTQGQLLSLLFATGIKKSEEMQHYWSSISVLISDRTLHEAAEKAKAHLTTMAEYLRNLAQKQSSHDKSKLLTLIGCQPSHCCVGKLEHQLDWVTKIWSRFRRDRNLPSLSYNDEQIHKMERIKLQERTVQGLSILQGHCIPGLQKVYAEVFKYLSFLSKINNRLRQAEKQLESVVECHLLLSSRLTKFETDYKQMFHQLMTALHDQRPLLAAEGMSMPGVLKTETSLQPDSIRSKDVVREISLGLSSLSEESFRIRSIIQENSDLLAQLQEHTNDLSDPESLQLFG